MAINDKSLGSISYVRTKGILIGSSKKVPHSARIKKSGDGTIAVTSRTVIK
mgnify:CR=1 FL=1